MPVDRPGDYVGDHGGAYTDMDGMRKQFTYIDHDKHTTRVKLGRHYIKTEEKESSPYEVLVKDIMESGLNWNSFFINLYDTFLAEKYEFERFNKGKQVENFLDTERGHEFFVDLLSIFRESVLSEGRKLHAYLNKDYGITTIQTEPNRENQQNLPITMPGGVL